MNDKMNYAMEEIDNKYLSEAEGYRRRRRPHLITGIVALLVVSFLVVAIPNKYSSMDTTAPTIQNSIGPAPEPSGVQSPGDWRFANLMAAPKYPEMLSKPSSSDYEDYDAYQEAKKAWYENYKAQYSQPEGYADSLTDFFLNSIPLFLDTAQNSAYSPVNVYMALAMLAETTDGNSRQQILDLLGLDSIEALRTQAGHLWNAHYCDDGKTTLLLGSSLWLDEAFSFRQECVDRLASDYYASSFRGNLGTPSMDQQLQGWLNANTGGLLQEQAKNIKLDPEAVFALATTIYFKAGWGGEFKAENNRERTFHCADHNLITTFMRQSLNDHTYYWADNFSAIRLTLSGENHMWLILPDEGYTVADILESSDYLRLTMDPDSWKSQASYKIHLSLPKFDVTSNTNLIPGLKELGITDVFDPSVSDFSAITDTSKLFVSGATHAARVVIDEQGCLAAAFTVIIISTESVRPEYPEIVFTLDRPFLFVVSSRDNLPLFVGTVAEP